MFDITQEEDYRELTLEEQYLVNGGEQIENSIEAQANASVGDTVTDSNGKTSTLTQGDIEWAQKVMAERNGSGGNGGTGSGSPNYESSGNSGGSSGSGSDNSSNNNNPFANNNTPWGAAEQMEAARLAKEKAKSYVDGLKANEVTAEVVDEKKNIFDKKDYSVYENKYLKVGTVSGGYDFKDTTPWEVEGSIVEFSSGGSIDNTEINSKAQVGNIEGEISYGSIDNPGFSVSAKVTALDFESDISFSLFGYKITISPNVMLGGIGAEATFQPGKIKAGLSIGVGGGIGVSWSKE
jgi:hypothetical protein